jgi:polar amino acid transport system substrate-binding protein
VILRLALVAAAVLAACFVSACGSGQKSTAAAPETVVQTIAAGELGEQGTLRACVDLASPPFAFVRAGRKTGFEVELLSRMARRLGVDLVWVPTPRADFATVLADRKCDVIVSRLGYDLDTQFHLNVGALQYIALPLVLVQPAGSGRTPVAFADLCGRRLAVVAWTAPAFDAVEQEKACRDGGEATLRLVEAPTSVSALELVRGGTAEAVLDDSFSAAALLTGRDGFDTVEVTGRKGYIAIGYRARRLSTEGGLHAALLSLYDDGVVRKLAAQWHLDGATLLPLP